MFCKIGFGLREGAMVAAVWNELSSSSRLQVIFMAILLVFFFLRLLNGWTAIVNVVLFYLMN